MPRMKKGERKVKVHDSTGNVFEDLGLPDPDVLLAKAEIARVIEDAIEERDLTQSKAAELLGVSQPDVSDLVRGKLSRFSLERLQRFLNALDFDVRIRVGPRPRGKKRADISVDVVSGF